MPSWALLRTWLFVAAAAVPWLVVFPSLDTLLTSVDSLDAPLDRSLRVPFGATFLSTTSQSFETYDRVLELSVGDEGRAIVPRDRDELWRALERAPVDSVEMRIARGRETAFANAARVDLTGWQVVIRNWPPIFVGAAFLVFGLAIALGCKHPVAAPLFTVTWCVGANLLAQLDLILPHDTGLHGIEDARARLAVTSLTILPASMIHLAMRFPVIAPLLRSSGVVAMPYVFWLFPAGFAQLQLDDATFLNTLEKVDIGATFVAAGILATASVTAIASMTPIERARTRALLVGIGLGSAVPFVYFVSAGKPPAALRAPFALSLLAFPAAICWAVVRYRLLDPPAWMQGALLTSLTAVISLLCASGLIWLSLSYLDTPGAGGSPEVIPVALMTALVFYLLQLGFRRGAVGRLFREHAFERFLEEASRDLASARRPGTVLERVEALLRTHLAASEVCCVTESGGAAIREPLIERGFDLWRRAGSPRDQIVQSGARVEDPGPQIAEVVVPLAPEGAPHALAVLASRVDCLPYDEEHHRMLVSLRHIATNALQAVATTADLESKVAEKTASLEQALSDRAAVLRSARAICEAQHPDDVIDAMNEFAACRGVSTRWHHSELGEGLTEEIGPDRREELAPQIETLRAFADLALGRLRLLADLKREVERQAQEIAEISSRRLHAEFVRDVAHELRKPTEEVRNRLEHIAASLPPELSPQLERIRAAGREMSRRLDLLLFHSGLRLDVQRVDLVRVVDDAVESTRAGGAARDIRVQHELSRLPMLADPSRLLSMVENLLDNAVKATGEGQAISLRTGMERDPARRGNWVWLEVIDEGRGIPADQLDQIFEPGVGFGPTGFGLGLSVCREIVRMHGGTITVSSRPGRTAFRIRMPQFHSEAGNESNGFDPAR